MGDKTEEPWDALEADPPRSWTRLGEWLRSVGPEHAQRCSRYPTLHRVDPTGVLVDAVAEMVDQDTIKAPAPVSCRRCGETLAFICSSPHGPVWLANIPTYSPERARSKFTILARRSTESRVIPLTGPRGYTGPRPPLVTSCGCGRHVADLASVVAAQRRAPQGRLMIDPQTGAAAPR